MKGYKGFDRNMQCRDFQFKEGETYEHKGDLSLCRSGFHFCVYPLDIFVYYSPAYSVFREINAAGVSDEQNSGDSKRVCRKLTVGAEVGIPGIVKAAVEYVISRATESSDDNTGNRSAATNTGNLSAATNTGDWSAATNTGNRSAATNTGDRSAARVDGGHSVAISTGSESKVSGSIGCAICCVERGEDGQIISILSSIVDGENIKADTWYTVAGGEWAEVEP